MGLRQKSAAPINSDANPQPVPNINIIGRLANSSRPSSAPVDTTVPGLLVAGYAAGPKDIPDSVVEASAAAGRAAELIGRRRKGGDHR